MSFFHPGHNIDRLNSFIKTRGETLTFYQGRSCDCARFGHPQSSCVYCQGTGFVVGAGVEVVFLVTGVKSHLKFIEAGILEAGDLILTIPTDSAYLEVVKPGDRLKLNLRRETREEVLARGEDTKDVLREAHVVSVGSITQGATTYEAEDDYEVSGNEITWVGSAPAAGSKYTVNYKYNPVYVVFNELPFTRTSKGTLLPRRLGMQKLELRDGGQ